jgi:hypothetical protein
MNTAHRYPFSYPVKTGPFQEPSRPSAILDFIEELITLFRRPLPKLSPLVGERISVVTLRVARNAGV